MPSWFSKEFRELELLDDITPPQFEGKLSAYIIQHRGSILIFYFMQWEWLSASVSVLVCDQSAWVRRYMYIEISWKIINRSKSSANLLDIKNNSIIAQGFKPIEHMVTNNQITSNLSIDELDRSSWDHIDYSCAYDLHIVLIAGCHLKWNLWAMEQTSEITQYIYEWSSSGERISECKA